MYETFHKISFETQNHSRSQAAGAWQPHAGALQAPDWALCCCSSPRKDSQPLLVGSSCDPASPWQPTHAIQLSPTLYKPKGFCILFVCCHGTENRCLHLTTPKHWPDPSKGQRVSQSLTSDAVQHLVLLILLRAVAAFLGAAGRSQKDIKQRQDLSGAKDLPQGLTVTDDEMAKLDGYQKTQPELLGCWTIVQFKYCRNFCIFLVFARIVK